MDVLILLPVLDDWLPADELLRRIDLAFDSSPDSVSILFVDDGSREVPPAGFASGPYRKITRVSTLVLKKNLGHQRAIAVGLCHISEHPTCDAVLVMDADGQDEPTDARRLVEKLQQLPHDAIVFAERTRRSEGFVFQASYLTYRVLHYFLTGRGIHIGNFSAIPVRLLPALTVEPMLWNHYAASVVRSRLRMENVPTHRRERIQGKSRLHFVSLVVHGLSALACYNETIGVRLFLAIAGISIVTLAALITLVALKFLHVLAIPGWTSIIAVLVIVLLLQLASLVSNFVMQAISTRTVQPFLPVRDFAWFISTSRTLYPPSVSV